MPILQRNEAEQSEFNELLERRMQGGWGRGSVHSPVSMSAHAHHASAAAGLDRLQYRSKVFHIQSGVLGVNHDEIVTLARYQLRHQRRRGIHGASEVRRLPIEQLLPEVNKTRTHHRRIQFRTSAQEHVISDTIRFQ